VNFLKNAVLEFTKCICNLIVITLLIAFGGAVITVAALGFLTIAAFSYLLDIRGRMCKKL